MRKKTLNLISLGCSKNLVDSEKILGQLPLKHYKVMLDNGGPADIVIINTCGFILDAKKESIDTILDFSEARKRGDIQKLIVMGCLSQRYREELPEEIPEVDAWFGVDQPHLLYAYLQQSFDRNSVLRYSATPSHYAYLKIAEGCNRACSFCAIPSIRGPYQSVPIPDLVREAEYLASKGVKELILIAQDLSYYGRDMGNGLLLRLLEQLLQIREFEWIRMHYLYPQGFPKGILRLMATEPRICRYLDIPMQHINDGILRSMRRGHSKRSVFSLISRLREQVPGLALRTTVMVGYPGETAGAFEELRQFITDVRFERLGVFPYSAEEGTGAYKLSDSIPAVEKERRVGELMTLQQGISEQLNRERIGKIMQVIIDREEDGYLVGRTEYDSPEVDNEVLVKKIPGVTIGSFLGVRIDAASDFELFASVTGQ